VVDKLIRERNDIKRLPFSPEDCPALSAVITADGDLRTTADMFGGIDGFYAARLQKL
jgi:16S rRNA (cytosine967-C5)-methyltransferase